MEYVREGLLVRLPVVHGKATEVEQWLESAGSSAAQAGVLAWIALRFWPSEYGIFAAFADDTARDAYKVTLTNTLQAPDNTLIRESPQLEKLTVLASKLPAQVQQPDTKGLLLTFKAKAGNEAGVEQFLRNAKAIVDEEPHTNAWFAIRLEVGDYGIFDVFPDEAGRFKHLTGGVARDLAAHALSLLGGFPDPALPSVIFESLSPR